jgi:Protein of unknown function (DUF3054)
VRSATGKPGTPRRTVALVDAIALLVFVTIGVVTHESSFTAWIRDLLCFEAAWFLPFRCPLVVRWLLAVTLAVAVRALIVGHFSVAFYLVALAFTAVFVGLARTLLRWRRSS